MKRVISNLNSNLHTFDYCQPNGILSRKHNDSFPNNWRISVRTFQAFHCIHWYRYKLFHRFHPAFWNLLCIRIGKTQQCSHIRNYLSKPMAINKTIIQLKANWLDNWRSFCLQFHLSMIKVAFIHILTSTLSVQSMSSRTGAGIATWFIFTNLVGTTICCL